MKPSIQAALLLCALFSNACLAQESSVCKAMCASEKRECRVQASRLSRTDNDSLFEMKQHNGDAIAMGRLQGNSVEERGRKNSDLQRRTSERDSACEMTALTCSRACSSPDPQAGASVLLKPAAKR